MIFVSSGIFCQSGDSLWDVFHDSWRALINWSKTLICHQICLKQQVWCKMLIQPRREQSTELPAPDTEVQRANPGACGSATSVLLSLTIFPWASQVSYPFSQYLCGFSSIALNPRELEWQKSPRVTVPSWTEILKLWRWCLFTLASWAGLLCCFSSGVTVGWFCGVTWRMCVRVVCAYLCVVNKIPFLCRCWHPPFCVALF